MSQHNASPFNERFNLALNYLGLVYLGERISIGGFAKRIEKETNYRDLPRYIEQIEGTIEKDKEGNTTIHIPI